MWVLVFVVLLNGEVLLDVKAQPDKWVCEAKEKEILAHAEAKKVPAVVKCKEIKMM
jgi:hypothetical protein